ncbi:uncharacterized protein LOC121603210 [Anopheles merus]|uniref:uncharacterized protein LOC121603210 n=1 Tax=Anopheles merus TaxID=30066 RepID=UPI001BE4CBE0|nr:uncharacterized protein LOC121603210 [Anopheles merus]
MLNLETGEIEYGTVGGYDRERIYLDKETGEVSSDPTEQAGSRRRRSKFHIPKQYLRNQCGIIGRRPAAPAAPSVSCALMACKQKMIPMMKSITLGYALLLLLLPNAMDQCTPEGARAPADEEITVGYNSTAHLLFLLPLLFVTPKLFALVISFVEVMLHMWAHRKNSTNGNPDVYYRSPMHVVTRQFCEVCRHERLMGRVGKLQDVRMKQMQNYFRKVTRNIA